MLVLLGAIIVTAAVMGGFIMAGSHPIHRITVMELACHYGSNPLAP